MHSPFDGPYSPASQEDFETKHWEQYGFNFGSWDEKKIHKIELPVSQMKISDFDWHLDVPYWDSITGGKFEISPRDVLNGKAGSEKEQERVVAVDMSYPIEVLFHEGKWFILDGVHRWIKAVQEGKEEITVRVFPKERLEEIR